MAGVYAFLILQLLSLHMLSTVAVTRATNLTLLRDRLTWNDARDACHHIGGHLVEIFDEAKNNAVIHAMQTLAVGLPLHWNMGTGLIQDMSTSAGFRWAQSCRPLTRNHWSKGVYADAKTEKRCGRIQRRSNEWARAKCEVRRIHMCEKTSGEECPYITYNQTTLQEDGVLLNVTKHKGSLSKCFDLCNVMMSHDDVECWAFSVNYDFPEQCTLFFTTDPYLVTNITYQFNDIKYTLFIKHCYHESVGEPYTVSGEENLSPIPEVNCTTFSETWTEATTTSTEIMTTSIETTTLSTAATTTSTEIMTTSIETTASSTAGTTTSTRFTETSTENTTTSTEATSASTEVNTLSFPVNSSLPTRTIQSTPRTSPEESLVTAQTPTVTSTETAVLSISDLVTTSQLLQGSTLTAGASEITTIQSKTNRSTSQLPSTIRTTDVSLTTATEEYSLHQRTKCYCPCRKHLSMEEKHRLRQEMLQNLTINRTRLSSFRRKYNSIMDDRPLSVGIGCSGIVFVALTLALILLCDVTKIGP